MQEKISKIVNMFNIDGIPVEIQKNNSGIINNTYKVTFKQDDGTLKDYLLQKINSSVFTEPYKLMKNIEGVTNYLKKKLIANNDTKHKVLEIIKTKDNQSLCVTLSDSGSVEYYRMYEYINNAISYDRSTDTSIVFHTGKAFGNFQKNLSDYPMDKLDETIKDFHDTGKRFQNLMRDIKIDPKNRAIEVAKEIVFVLKREEICSTIMSKIWSKDLPLRVTHNDTKVNNVMINKDNADYLAVIDLDTVMPGSMLFDYGDGIRSTSSHSSEDSTNLDEVYLDLELFKSYTDGYLSEMAPYLTNNELSLMGESIRIITLELAIRFLSDYINGDTYFKNII